MLCRNRELPLFCLGSTPPSCTTRRGGRRCIGRKATTSSWTASGCRPPHPRRVRRNVWTTTGLCAPRRQRSSTRLFLPPLLPRRRRCPYTARFGKQATQIGAWWTGTSSIHVQDQFHMQLRVHSFWSSGNQCLVPVLYLYWLDFRIIVALVCCCLRLLDLFIRVALSQTNETIELSVTSS
jgi:hypothetical protein